MTRKHCVAIAEAVKQHTNTGDVAVDTEIAQLANKLARVLAGANPNFDRGRFMKACGL